MEQFLTENSIYIVLIIALIIWLGISIYLFKIDSKIVKLEKQLNNINNQENANES